MKTLSFVIPCYNEEARIEKTFEALNEVELPRGLKLSQVIFVDDGSTDSTFEKLSEYAKISNFPITIISYMPNHGKGYAVREGMLASKSDYTLFFDADMSTPLSEIEKLVSEIKKGTDVIIGTRKNGHSTVVKHQPIYREIMGKVFTRITQYSLQVNVTDFTCGFKVFSKKSKDVIFSEALIDGWGYDAEIVFLAQLNGFSIAEQAVTWANDDRTKVKLGTAIFGTLYELGKIRYTHSVRPTLSLFAQPIFNLSILQSSNTK